MCLKCFALLQSENCPQQTLIEHLQRKDKQKIKALQSKYANLMGRNKELATSRDALALSVNALESKRTNLKTALNAQLYAAVQQNAKFELAEQNNDRLSRDLQQARAELDRAAIEIQELRTKAAEWQRACTFVAGPTDAAKPTLEQRVKRLEQMMAVVVVQKS